MLPLASAHLPWLTMTLPQASGRPGMVLLRGGGGASSRLQFAAATTALGAHHCCHLRDVTQVIDGGGFVQQVGGVGCCLHCSPRVEALPAGGARSSSAVSPVRKQLALLNAHCVQIRVARTLER